MGTALTKTPEYAVQRAGDDYTKARFTASRGARLMGDSSRGDAEEDLVAIIQGELPDAIQFIDSEVGTKRAMATEYYHGDRFGNEEDGRSKVVSRDVLAVVQALMPSIMRTFFGGRRRVRYRPNTPEDIAFAEQATELITKITLVVDNNGFMEFFAAAKDALIRYQGIFKWWWDDAKEVTTDTYTGQDHDALLLLANDPEITDIRVYEEDALPGQPKTYSVLATRVVKHLGKARFGCVPTNEVLVNRDAKTFGTARFVDHRRPMLVGELVALGYDLEDVLEHAGEISSSWSREAQVRSPLGLVTTPSSALTANELQLPVVYHEVYLRADMDGDEYPELLKVCGLGEGATFHLLHWEPVSEIPFASLDPDPEPHTLIGSAPGPNVMDVQLIKSSLLRMGLDGGALALDPRLAVVEHMVELDDLLNNEIGGIVRTRAVGQIEPIRFDYQPAAIEGLLAYMDQVIEDRTGRSRASQGLDADALQSSAKLAVAATLSGAQQQQEIICRLFAEGGWKDVLRGLLRLHVRHATGPRMIQLRGEWVKVDPRTWNADMDVEIDVAVGVGGIETEIQGLQERKLTQEAILQLYGPDNPMVTLANYRDTLVQLDELRGLPDAESAFKPVPKDWTPPKAGGAPSEAEIIQQTAMAELELKKSVSAAELRIKYETMMLQDERERLKIRLDYEAQMANAKKDTEHAQMEALLDHEATRHEIERGHEASVIDTLITGVTDMHAAETQAAAQPAAPAP